MYFFSSSIVHNYFEVYLYHCVYQAMNKVFFHLFSSSFISLSKILYFPMHRPFTSFVRIIPKYFIILPCCKWYDFKNFNSISDCCYYNWLVQLVFVYWFAIMYNNYNAICNCMFCSYANSLTSFSSNFIDSIWFFYLDGGWRKTVYLFLSNLDVFILLFALHYYNVQKMFKALRVDISALFLI